MYADTESERCILAAMLNSETALIEATATMQTDDFYEPRHAAMFDVLTSLYSQGVKPALLELLKEGAKRGTLSSVEDRAYVKEISESYISDASLDYWRKNAKDKSKLRRLRQSLKVIAEDMKNPGADVDELILRAERAITNLEADTTDKIETGAELAALGRKVIEERRAKKGQLRGIPTGISKLDRLTSGWKPGDLILLAASTGQGKTAFAQNFICRACFLSEIPTVYVNSEMSSEQVILRWSAMVSEFASDRIKFGELSDKERDRVFAGMNLLEYAPLYHYRCPTLNLQKVVGVIRKLHVQKGIQFVVVDYVGRMDKLDKDLKEWQVLEQVCKTLKTLAQELEISILLLGQLNDDQSLQAAKRMQNEADIFVKLRPMDPEEAEEAQRRNYKVDPNYWIHVSKNRDGQSDVLVPVLFQKETLSVIDVAAQ